jgi:hypothetical protein
VSEFITKHGCSEAAPPWVHPAKSSSRAQISKPPLNTISKATDHCRPKGKTRNKTPARSRPREQGSVSGNGDDAHLAVPERSCTKWRIKVLSVSQRTTQVSVREVRSNRDTTIAGAEPD